MTRSHGLGDDEGVFRLLVHLSVRLGWTYGEVGRLTARQARWALDELDEMDDYAANRMAEAYHAPAEIGKRIRGESAVTGAPADFAKLARALRAGGAIPAEKVNEIEKKQAAVAYLRRNRVGQ